MANPNEPTDLAISAEINDVDIAIVGGAMAGATLALGLAQLVQELKLDAANSSQPLKIALIEAHKPSNEHPGFDARSIAISHGSIFQLQQLGLWQHLDSLATPISNIHVSDRGHFGMTELNSESFHLPYLGQVVELEAVGNKLFSLLEKSDIALYCPNKLQSIEASMDSQLLTLEDGQQIAAKLVVAADGVNSKVRQAFKQPLEQIDFGQSAIIANIHTEQPHEGWAYERFTQTGPLALLPMADSNGESRLSLVWALPPGEAERLLTAPKSEFIDKLQQAFGYRAGRFIDIGNRFSYPLLLSYMPRPIYHRTVFLGNAAQTLHPIAGQGFNLGLRDVVCLIDVVKQELAKTQLSERTLTNSGGELVSTVDLGSTALTHGYLERRNADRQGTMNSIEFLVRGFSNDHWPLVIGRNLGLRLLSWFPPLKAPVAQKAMGWINS
ncbi:2-octaprenyl-6-methoxyphenyl hydroxylase [Shewanella schlegeliana]|uniref:2-octaprenyl-6-methoxyphenyl hydroxylase n=1 Tax=Shewanella schlegeliana TaxID=190308 RepID=A0ABS1T0T0_9GAMM|nr:2-octaprenyl-6-methoxyphenyl hydroxylase [Shewanella schlegeliana]MBL4914381.1 2-octaprenyl-6-methoxyphenyl hydroxylase [Shewanella schlegeliana]MCL1109395.1 2-octaprenyl-6-methoxyphenyl hydroxylase [Shewanella schlegeliana]GIU31903.1 2-octaprenyl-6-methoxyphenyl hydroxylase [Shewanella schlegeliana]